MRITGFGVIDKSGNKLIYVGSGCVKTSEDELPVRLKSILDNLGEVITQYQPDHVAIEQVFVNAMLKELKVSEYTALQIKQAVVGNGHARKNQVQEMVMRLLSLNSCPTTDAADALACAICHAHGGFGLGRISTDGYRMKRGRLV